MNYKITNSISYLKENDLYYQAFGIPLIIMVDFLYYYGGTNHLEESRMSYCEHLRRAMYISLTMGLTSLKTMVHAVCPGMFVTSASDYVRYMHTTVFAQKHNNDDTELVEMESEQTQDEHQLP
jgi:hypothetical protein